MNRTKEDWINLDPNELDDTILSYYNKIESNGMISKSHVHYCTERKYREIIIKKELEGNAD